MDCYRKEKMNKFFNISNKWLVGFVLLILISITFLTHYYGSTDIGDYSDVAKYFAGKLASSIRGSHSYLYGFINAPFVNLTGSFISFKVFSIASLLLLIFSVYYISGKNLRALWLIALSPSVWYLAPWINPIQIASIFLLWGYFYINRYEHSNRTIHLFLSGVFVGLAIAFWDTMVFFGSFLAISFLYNKKIYNGF